MAIERAAARVRAVRVSPRTLEVRAGERLTWPDAWAVDSAGREVVGFVPLFSFPNDSVVGRRDGYVVALQPGRTAIRVEPMHWRPRSGGEAPATQIVVIVKP